jgi:hypothetical protein
MVIWKLFTDLLTLMITEHQRIFEPVSEIKYQEIETRRTEIEEKRKRKASKKSSSEEESKDDHDDCKPIEVETYYGEMLPS